MKVSPRVFLLVILSIGMLLVWDSGFLQRKFDKRSIVYDGIAGGDYYVIGVDGQPVERVEHGLVFTKVPMVLIEPGVRRLRLSYSLLSKDPSEFIEIDVSIREGAIYMISETGKGPELVVKD